MSKESISKIEAWLRDFFKDFGNLAVALASMGKFKDTEEMTSDDELVEENPKVRRILRAQDVIKDGAGEFFIPSHRKRD